MSSSRPERGGSISNPSTSLNATTSGWGNANAGDPLATGSGSGSTVRKASEEVVVDEHSEFDLEAYAASYTGRRKVDRLLFTARSCPSLSSQAYVLALSTIKSSTLDVNLYNAVSEELLSLPSGEGRSLGWKPDLKWVGETRGIIKARGEKLDTELRTYINNLIKESIRMGYRDLANFQVECGDVRSAIKNYIKTREYCTTADHLLEMCLNIIDVGFDLENYYSVIRNYITKAENTLETLFPSPSSQTRPTRRETTSSSIIDPPKIQSPEERRKELLRDRLDLANAVTCLGLGGSGGFKKCAMAIGNLNKARVLELEKIGALPASPADLALYLTLCGLATFDRAELKSRLIDNSDIRGLLELEGHLRELISAFHNNRFKDVLDILRRNRPRYLLDPHLSPHFKSILSSIRTRALVQYFKPFESVRISKMAASFGWEEEETESEVVEKIESGELNARVDTINRIVKAYNPDLRSTLYKQALRADSESKASTRAVLLRLKLIQAGVLVRDPEEKGGKRGGGGGGGGNGSGGGGGGGALGPQAGTRSRMGSGVEDEGWMEVA